MSALVKDAYARGISDAFAHFVKRGGLKEMLGGAKNLLIGQPGKAFIEGPGAFRPGGMLSHQNIWWPKTEGLTGMQKVMPWLQRAGTAAIPFQMMGAAHDDPDEGALSNMLGRAGSIAGFAYGMPAAGMLGAPMLAEAGRSVGHGVGHLLGSHPKDQP